MQFDLWREELFDSKLLAKWLDTKKIENIPDLDSILEHLHDWKIDLLNADMRNETTIEQRFNSLIFEKVLGYKLAPSAAAAALPKPSSHVTGIRDIPDLILGSFKHLGPQRIDAVVELKRPGTELDAPQPRPDPKSPVEQAFKCGQEIMGVKWVIVSDMRFIRLYSVDNLRAYEEFDISDCVVNKQEPNTNALKRFYFLLHKDYLIGDSIEEAASMRLLGRSHEEQVAIGRNFYEIYYSIRGDLIAAISHAVADFEQLPSRFEIIQAAQRLIDRIIFLCFCEDHPDSLIPRVLERVTTSARTVPGGNVYSALKEVFREMDKGSPSDRELILYGYNGELFKPHRILDSISLPNTLHDKKYRAEGADGTITVQGAWGLYEFNFWRELNERLLGQIFEESLSDAVDLLKGEVQPLAEKLAERKRQGIYYTSKILSDFLLVSSIESFLTEALADSHPASDEELLLHLKRRLELISSIKIADFACGSGAFIVSAYDALSRQFFRTWNAINRLEGNPLPPMLERLAAAAHAAQLREGIYGVDLLPQAVEIAKLSLWLKSAQKDHKISNLERNIVAEDSLNIPKVRERLGASNFDLIVGNPPWGSEMTEASKQAAISELGIDSGVAWDSWELFLIHAIKSLRPGGRLALVLPDTLLAPEKARVRQFLLQETEIEKLHNLGPDWFGVKVRMGTLILQARKGKTLTNTFKSFILFGQLRKDAMAGKLPLRQIESQLSREIPQQRCEASRTFDIELFRDVEDDVIMPLMESQGIFFGDLCVSNRGEEISTSGLLWRCSACYMNTTPGSKEKGGGYKDKTCPNCGHHLRLQDVQIEHLVSEAPIQGERSAPFIDGGDLSVRYVNIRPRSYLRLLPEWKYKDPELYRTPKILIREAGVGLAATLDETGAYCPRSLFVYRLKPEYKKQGYAHEFVLAALLSRTAAYYIFKRYGEIDPDKAHAKITHEELAEFPIPVVDFKNRQQARIHDSIVKAVRRIRSSVQPLNGGSDDLSIEQNLRALWGLSPTQGAYINSEFSQVPQGQAVRDLFPAGVPKKLAD